jgi:hypothetical protein
MKIDRGVTNCLARWGLNETDLYVLHWSGPRKPYHQQSQQTLRTQRTQQNQQRGSSSGSRSGSGSGKRDSQEGEGEGAPNPTTEATFARLYRDSYFYWADELRWVN